MTQKILFIPNIASSSELAFFASILVIKLVYSVLYFNMTNVSSFNLNHSYIMYFVQNMF
ncbi:Uncharacterised protein [Actinobacillus equuli]|nr:Uncharacterised protein [Actinobacillus equuli]